MIVLEVKTYAKPKQFKAVDEAIGICQFLRNKSIRLGSDKVLPAKVSQQILMILDKNWKSFFEAVKAYKADSSKFTDRPKLPKYKDKVKGRNILVYTIQAISSQQLKKGIVNLSGSDLSIKTKIEPDRICQVRLVTKCDS